MGCNKAEPASVSLVSSLLSGKQNGDGERLTSVWITEQLQAIERERERARALSVATGDVADRWMERMTGCPAKWKDNFYPHRLYAFACRLLSPSLIHNLKENKLVL